MNCFRKKFCLMLAVVLAFSASLSGCSSSSSKTSTTASNSTLAPYNIVWYRMDDIQPDTSAVEKKINAYLAKSTDINATVSINELGFADYNTKMPVIISSGQNFDLCSTCNWSLNYSTYSAQGAFVDLTSKGLIDKYGKGIISALGETMIKGSSINGDLYAVPVNKEAAYQWGLLLNTGLIKKYNIDLSAVKAANTPLDKMKAMTPILKTIHEKEPAAINQLIGNSSILNLAPYYNNFFADIAGINAYATNGKVENVFATDYFSGYCDLMHEWYKDGYIQSDAATLTTVNTNKTMFMSYYSYTPYIETTQTNGCTTFVALQDPVISGAVGTGAMTAISNTSKDSARAMMFLNLLYTDKTLLNLVDYGIKGQDYTTDSEGKVTQLTKKGTSSQTTSTYLYAPQKWTVGNEFLSYVLSTEKTDKWEKYKKFNNSAKVGQDVGFNFNSSNITSELSALSNVISQYEPSLITGSVDPSEYLPKFLSALNDAGASTVIKEVQSQFDKWKTKTSSSGSN
jgi:putative aldouronate transport system substrate-binding protein